MNESVEESVIEREERLWSAARRYNAGEITAQEYQTLTRVPYGTVEKKRVARKHLIGRFFVRLWKKKG